MQVPRREIILPRALYWAVGVLAVGVALYWLRDILTPIFLAFMIAYLLDPVVDRLETWRLPRAAAVALVLFGFLGAIAGFLLLVVPDVAKDVATVVRELPSHAQRALAKAEPWLTKQGIQVPHTADEWIASLKGQTDNLSSSMLAPVGVFLKSVIGGTASMIGAVLGALIVPILAVYLLNDFDRMIAAIRELIPPRWQPTVVTYAKEIDQVLSQFMRGQVTVMAILAVLYGGSYWLIGVRLAIPIGIAAGILNFVPYVGGMFALVAGIFMTLIGGGGMTQIFLVVAAYAVVQTLEGFVITPRIVGESVGLSELWVLVALFIGGEIFGFLGVLLAVPAAAVIKIFVQRGIVHYRESALFLPPADELVVPLAAGPPIEAATSPPVNVSVPVPVPETVNVNVPEPAPSPEAFERDSAPDSEVPAPDSTPGTDSEDDSDPDPDSDPESDPPKET
jgi:predicted PurR-regulated permease PerM